MREEKIEWEGAISNFAWDIGARFPHIQARHYCPFYFSPLPFFNPPWHLSLPSSDWPLAALFNSIVLMLPPSNFDLQSSRAVSFLDGRIEYTVRQLSHLGLVLENVPSKPRSGWQIFCRENLKNHKGPDGKTNIVEANRALSAQWHSLPEADKEVCLLGWI